MARNHDYPVISADSHAEEPSELYDRLPSHLQARRPRIEEINGYHYYIVDGQGIRNRMEARNPLTEEEKRKEFRHGEALSAGYDREGGADIPLRLADQEEDGIRAEIIYPNSLLRVFTSPSVEYQLATSGLYNDWYIETFGGHPDRFVPSAVIPIIDVEGAISEAQRAIRLGFRSLSLPISRPSLPYNQPAYERLWFAVEHARVPMSFHTFTKSETRNEGKSFEEIIQEEPHGSDLIGMVMGMAEAMTPLTMLTASGALDRHPDLKLVLVECGTGWLAWALYAMDDVAKRRHMHQQPRLAMLPSEYFRRQGYITFGDDPVGLHNIRFTGADCLMWGSDYPHDEGTFPHSREVIEETFKEVSEEEKWKIVGENAARLYRIPITSGARRGKRPAPSG